MVYIEPIVFPIIGKTIGFCVFVDITQKVLLNDELSNQYEGVIY